MYRKSEEYERMVDLAIGIIEDYSITLDDYPLNMDDLYRKMNIQLVPYSAFDSSARTIELMLVKSKDGFYAPKSSKSDLTVFYNDRYGDHPTRQRISQTKGHELKHIFENDMDDSEDDLCDYFAKYLRCPFPLVVYLGINSVIDLMARFDLSQEQAFYVLSNRRLQKYGRKLFPKEVELLRQLIGESFDESAIEIIE